MHRDRRRGLRPRALVHHRLFRRLIFEQRTGTTIFKALDQELAKPLGFEDFDLSRQRMMGFKDRSRFLAYHLFLSARDMARLGEVMAQAGTWRGKQVVAADWVRESTKPRVAPADVGRSADFAYGYLWWIPVTRPAPQWAGSFMMSGQFGQFVLVLPAIDTVIVHRRAVADEYAIARNLGTTKFEPTRVQAPEFLKLADAVVAAIWRSCRSNRSAGRRSAGCSCPASACASYP